MSIVLVLLALAGLVLGLSTVSRLLGVGGSGVVAGRRSLPVLWPVLAVAALVGMFAVAYTQARTWMVVLSWIVLAIVVVGGLLFRLMAPPIERIEPGELAHRIEAYAHGPGPHSMSFAVQGSLLATIQGEFKGKVPRSRFARHVLADASCLYCFVERSVESLFEPEAGRGAAVVEEYRGHLRTGPNVEVHMRRQESGQPWHLEFAVPKQQPPWNSEFGRMACTTHRPAGVG